jgi:hypothetical protein
VNTLNIIRVRMHKKCSACKDRYDFSACFAGRQVESFQATSTVYSYHFVREAAVELQKVILRCIFDNAQDGGLFCAIPFFFPLDLSCGKFFFSIFLCHTIFVLLWLVNWKLLYFLSHRFQNNIFLIMKYVSVFLKRFLLKNTFMKNYWC